MTIQPKPFLRLRTFLMAGPFLLLASCSITPDPMVSTEKDVFETTYAEYQPALDSLMNEIAALQTLEFFGKKPEKLEEPMDLNFIKLMISLQSPIEFQPDSFHPTEENCLMIHDKSNVVDQVFQMSTLIQLVDSSQNWMLTEVFKKVPKNRSYFNRILRRQRIGSWPENMRNDSITQIDSARLRRVFEEDLQGLLSKEYVLLVNDIIYNPPIVMDGDSFESGILLIQSDLYSFTEHRVVARQFHQVDNDDLIQYKEYQGDGMQSAMNLPVGERLRRNLLQNRNLVVLNDYKMLSKSERKFELEER